MHLVAMMLLCGIPSEPPLAMAMAAADAQRLAYAVFNQRESRFADIAIDVDAGGVTGALWMRERTWPLERFTGVYLRLLDPGSLPEHRSRGGGAAERAMVERSHAVHDALTAWCDMAPCRVVNRRSAMTSNASKPCQAQSIRRSGFRTPPTLVSNDPDAVLAFRASHGRVIYKSVSSVRSIVRELGDEDLARLDAVRDLPTQFQAYVPGVDVRVHVVGERVFATEILSDAVDYRYAERERCTVRMQPHRLPRAVADRGRSLAESFGLSFCGIDLRRMAGGEYVCFEVNPSPAYSYFEAHTAQPIAAALVRHLAGRTA